MLTRTNRQKLGIKKWIQANGKGTWCYSTGFGKTWTAVMLILKIIKVKPDAHILISVPTDVLQKQWMNEYIIKYNLIKNCEVKIINSIVRTTWNVDLLIIDEIHLTPTSTFGEIFNCVEYDMILGLTATLERLDGKEEFVKQYAPVIDIVSITESINNGWLSPYKEYLVLLDVDLTEYNNLNQKFIGFFSQLNFDFNLAMRLSTNIIERNKYAKKLGIPSKTMTAICMGWMNCLQKRKKFIQNHPHKLEVARKILDARKDKKCITFCATIKDAEKLSQKNEFVLHSKQSKKTNEQVISKFNQSSTGVLHSSKAANQGLDIKGLSVEIILSTDSSKITKTQRIGRTIRFEENKVAEVFTLVLKNTVDEKWYANSLSSNCIVINENQLDQVLNNESIQVRERTLIKDINNRY